MTNHFPRLHRHTITRRLPDAARDFQEDPLEANTVRAQAHRSRLGGAHAYLDKVRLYFRLAHRWRWINAGQYEHAARLVAELGRLLGGWQTDEAASSRQGCFCGGRLRAARVTGRLLQQQ